MARFDYQPDDYEPATIDYATDFQTKNDYRLSTIDYRVKRVSDSHPATIDYELATIDFQGLSTLSARKRLATFSRLWDLIDFGDFLAWAIIDYGRPLSG